VIKSLQKVPSTASFAPKRNVEDGHDKSGNEPLLYTQFKDMRVCVVPVTQIAPAKKTHKPIVLHNVVKTLGELSLIRGIILEYSVIIEPLRRRRESIES
jgi:hypothetical protein